MSFLSKHLRLVHILMAGMLALAGLSQLPLGQRILTTSLAHHPRLGPIISALVGCGFLLLNPKVQDLIKQKTGIDLSADQAKLAADRHRLQQGQDTLAAAKEKAQAAMKPPPSGEEKTHEP